MEAASNDIELPIVNFLDEDDGDNEEDLAFGQKLDNGDVAIWWKETQAFYVEEEEGYCDVKLNSKLFAHLKWVYNPDEMVINLEVEVVKTDEESIDEGRILYKIYSLREGFQQQMTFDEEDKKWKLVLDSDICSDCFSSCGCNEELPRGRFNPLLFQYAAAPVAKEGPIKTKGEQIILDHLQKLLQDQTLADVTFTLGGEVIKAHSIIIAAGSSVLAAMFEADLEEKTTRIVRIEDIKPQVFSQLLNYLYVGIAPDIKNENMTADLLVAADKYAVEPLKLECATILCREIKVENAVRLLILAHLHSVADLFKTAMDFIAKHGKQVCSRMEWLELIENYPKLCFQATQLMLGFS